VTLVGTSAIINKETDLCVSVVAQESHEIQGDVLITADSGATVLSEDAWKYVPPGFKIKLSRTKDRWEVLLPLRDPIYLQAAPGANVITSVLLSGVSAAILEQNNTNILVKVYPGRTVGFGDVRITTDSGAFIVLEDGWEYLDAGDINDVSPSSGQFGTIVSITGTSLLGGVGARSPRSRWLALLLSKS